MKKWGALIVSGVCTLPVLAASDTLRQTVRFTAAQSEAVGAVDKLVVTVSCGWILSLQNVPELYNVEMGYDMPTVNVFEAHPRLGAAAVPLNKWSGVITATGSDRSCFSVAVRAEGRTGELETNKQLRAK